MATKQVVEITPPNMQTVEFHLIGTAPLVIKKFAEKARQEMKAKQIEGSTAKRGKQRQPKDFIAQYEAAKHISQEGWNGFPCAAIRGAMISACRLVDYKMTKAKISIFIQADGYDKEDYTQLVKITKGEPHYFESIVRVGNPPQPDVTARPMWDPGWECIVRITYDADQMKLQEITNLLARAGMQVGICEGRPSSENSCGMGWGLFRIKEEAEDGK